MIEQALALQWHPTRNGDLKPRDVTAGSNRKIWWVCQFGHQWQAAVYSRTGGRGCPVCAGKLVLAGFNDLATTHPGVAVQWHPARNGDLGPCEVIAGSHRKVWWVCQVGHEWQVAVGSRTGGSGCPVCAGRQVLVGFNDLATIDPEVAAQWHPARNGDLGPGEVTAGSGRKVWWVCRVGHEWLAAVVNRTSGCGCPVCAGRQVLVGFNDLATTHPAVAAQWHPARNDDLGPGEVTAGSGRKVWWVCQVGHQWQAVVANRIAGKGCPVCAGHQVQAGFNDLATTHPAVAAQWHPTRNGALSPSDVTRGSNREVWWVCRVGHQWQAVVANRTGGRGCPVCAGQQALAGFNDLATTHPVVAARWHSARNGDLGPCDVTAGTDRKVWWVCELGHQWRAAVSGRTGGSGCPVCAGNQVLVGFNDLATAQPEVAAQWHPVRNGDLGPCDVTAGSTRKVWWVCELGHQWQANVKDRSRGNGCPICSGKQTLAGFNDLATTHPKVAARWHPTRNGGLGARSVTAGSNRKVWWVCELGHPWQAVVSSRANGAGCPVCAGNQVLVGFNDLATTHPEVAARWHPTRNGDLGPCDVSAGSNRKIWWMCELGHQWQVMVVNRTSGSGCPVCAGRQVLAGFNDLATTHPAVAAQWHPTRNDDLGPCDVSAGSTRKVWWVCELGHQWQAAVFGRTGGSGCLVCAGRLVLAGFNDLATTHPAVAARWHPTRNDDLGPRDVTKGSNRKVWWVCMVGHQWLAMVNARVRGSGCPACARTQVQVRIGDLVSTHPDLAEQWHPSRNGDLGPHDVSAGMTRKVWWVCELGHQWQAAVSGRAGSGYGCPVCSGKQVLVGFNDLGTTHPEIAAQWHPVCNGDLGPCDVTKGSSRKVWWVCELGHQWQAAVGGRSRGSGCPLCAGKQVLVGFNDLATTRPDVAAQWRPIRNGDLGPCDLSRGSKRQVWWACPAGHLWQAMVTSRSRGSGCPVCAGKQVLVGFNDLATTHPEVAARWHPTRNDDLSPHDVSAGTDRKVWWVCEARHQWRATVKNRARGNGCPMCVRTSKEPQTRSG